jgi:hypothetical protein
MWEFSCIIFVFFLLQFNAQCEKEDDDNDTFKHIIIVYFFATT